MTIRIVTVSSGDSESRLDRVLATHVSDASRTRLAELIRAGRVQVDGIVHRRPSFRVEPGQEIRIELPEPERTSAPAAAEIPLDIVHQDEQIAVIDKPAGLVVHPAAGHRDDTLVNALLHHLEDLSGIGGELRPGIIHRLDKDTSGLIVVAKSDEAHRFLSSIWSEGDVQKSYLAIVYGRPGDNEGTVDAPIGRDPKNRKKMAIVRGGRPAVTHWMVERELRHLSILRCELATGRTHQIRVHLRSIGHPIVGDPVYSGAQWKGIPDRRLKAAIASTGRQALHAARLSFPHPESRDRLVFESPLPDDMQILVDLASDQR